MHVWCRITNPPTRYNMVTKQFETAQSGREARHPERHSDQKALEPMLERIQRVFIPESDFLMCESWDWLVVLQWMQDKGLFKRNPKRPPLGAFVQWLEEHQIPQYVTKCSIRELSYAHIGIHGARYPWTDVTWEPYVIERWRMLYRRLDKMLEEMR